MSEPDFFATVTPEDGGFRVKLYFDGGRHPSVWRQRWVRTEAEAEQQRREWLFESTGRAPSERAGRTP